MIGVYPTMPEKPPPSGGFPPYGDLFTRGTGDIKGSTAEGANGGWPWGGQEQTGATSVYIDDSTGWVGMSGGGNTTTVFTPALTSATDQWVESVLEQTTSIAGVGGPSLNVPDFGPGIAQGYTAYLAAAGQVDVVRNGAATAIATVSGLSAGARIGMQITADDVLRLYVDGSQVDSGSVLSAGSRLGGDRVGYYGGSAGHWASWSAFKGDAGTYPG